MSAPLITVEDIEEVYAIPDGIVPAAFIRGAHLAVENAGLAADADTQKEIELYVAVHFIHTYEPQSTKYLDLSINGASLGRFLQSSFYGQMALMLDTEGKLTNWGLRKRVVNGS